MKHERKGRSKDRVHKSRRVPSDGKAHHQRPLTRDRRHHKKHDSRRGSDKFELNDNDRNHHRKRHSKKLLRASPKTPKLSEISDDDFNRAYFEELEANRH